jgi:hypothetical protein
MTLAGILRHLLCIYLVLIEMAESVLIPNNWVDNMQDLGARTSGPHGDDWRPQSP